MKDLDTLRRWEALAAVELDGWRWWRWANKPDSARYLMSSGVAAGYRLVPAVGDEPPLDNSLHPIPPYATDLNVVARLERLVRTRDLATHYRYVRVLHLISAAGYVPGNPMAPYTANAAQRLEAVLLTCGLIGASESQWVTERDLVRGERVQDARTEKPDA